MLGCVGIGRFGIVDEENVALAADLLHAMSEPRERAQSFLQDILVHAERESGGRSSCGILPVMRAAERTDPAELCELGARTALGTPNLFMVVIEPVGQR